MDETLAGKLMADLLSELDRRSIQYDRNEVCVWLNGALGGQYVWEVSTVQDLADRWQRVAERHWTLEDLG